MIDIATMGMFRGFCMKAGAPPYRRDDDDSPRPFILVKKVEMKTLKEKLGELTITLIDE